MKRLQLKEIVTEIFNSKLNGTFQHGEDNSIFFPFTVDGKHFKVIFERDINHIWVISFLRVSGSNDRKEVKRDISKVYHTDTRGDFRKGITKTYNQDRGGSLRNDMKYKSMSVYRIVLSAIRKFLDSYSPRLIFFVPNEKRQEKLYQKLSSKYLPSLGYERISINPITNGRLASDHFLFAKKSVLKDNQFKMRTANQML